MSCVSAAQLFYPPARTGELEALTLSDDPIPLRDGAGQAYELSLQQQYQVVRSEGRRGPWKVSSQAYRYEVRGPHDDNRLSEWLSWHWHPRGQSPEKRPHLHVQHGPLQGLHIGTGRTSIEAVLRFMLAELRVLSRRDDWEQVLNEAEGPFQEWRTWS